MSVRENVLPMAKYAHCIEVRSLKKTNDFRLVLIHFVE